MAQAEPELGCKAGSVRGIQLNGGYVLQCDERGKECHEAQKGDHIVLTGGLINGKTGNTNVIKVETV